MSATNALRAVNRRDFLKLTGLAGGGFALAEEGADVAFLEVDVGELFELSFEERLLLGIPVHNGGGGHINAFGGELEGPHDVQDDDGGAILLGEDTGP